MKELIGDNRPQELRGAEKVFVDYDDFFLALWNSTTTKGWVLYHRRDGRLWFCSSAGASSLGWSDVQAQNWAKVNWP